MTRTHLRFKNPYVELDNHDLQLKDSLIPAIIRPQFAQCSEDLIVESLLKAIALKKGLSLADLRYFEIGANHPVSTSSTYLFYRMYGAKGVLVEANPDLFDALQSARPRDLVVNAAVIGHEASTVFLTVSEASELSSINEKFPKTFQNGAYAIEKTIEVPAVFIGDLLAKNWSPDCRLSYISIDVEGVDFELLAKIDFRKYPFDVVQIEPSDLFIPGNSLKIISHMAAQNYLLIAKTEVNLIFVLA